MQIWTFFIDTGAKICNTQTFRRLLKQVTANMHKMSIKKHAYGKLTCSKNFCITR